MLLKTMLSLASLSAILLAILAYFLLHRKPSLDLEDSPGPLDEKNLYSHENISTPDSFPKISTLTPELPESVTRSSINRDAWVLRMTHHVFDERHQNHYNVLVINNDLEYHLRAVGIVEEFLVKYYETKIQFHRTTNKVVTYRIVVFKEGSVVNMGDGGDINWDWQGNFVRSAAKIVDFKPCVSGVRYQQDPWVAVRRG